MRSFPTRRSPDLADRWRDDAQVVDLHVVKDYPGPAVAQTVPGVLITVHRVTDPAAPALL